MSSTNTKLRILHLEDDDSDAELIRLALVEEGLEPTVVRGRSAEEFRDAAENQNFDLVLSDSSVAGFDGLSAVKLIRQKNRQVPFIVVSGYVEAKRWTQLQAAGATDCVSKTRLAKLGTTVKRVLRTGHSSPPEPSINYVRGMERLIAVVQDLSLARSLDEIMKIVRTAAREITGADGATFVLRDNGQCFYADEDAIGPLWKGSRFPLTACISGWTMLNQRPAVVEDIFHDPRIPLDAYLRTFVRSLVTVPIRTESPIGAIGNYWAKSHRPTDEEVKLLQALADSTSIAMENVQLYSGLESLVKDRTAELEQANKDLESFSYSVSHDLRAPLRSIEGFSRLLQMQAGDLDEKSASYVQRIVGSTQKMGELIEDLLKLAGLGRGPIRTETVDLTAMAREYLSARIAESPARQVNVVVDDDIQAQGDPGLLRALLENLLSNAWKYSSKVPEARIQVGCTPGSDGKPTYFVKDNGAGFDPEYAGRLFGVFQRLHHESEFPGTGIGLATAHRVVRRHGGRIWAESTLGKGATFYFTLS